MLNFQQLTLDLTGQDIPSASLLNEVAAANEAVTLAQRASKLNQANRFFVVADVHLQTLDVVRIHIFGFKLAIDKAKAAIEHSDLCGVFQQQFGTTGVAA